MPKMNQTLDTGAFSRYTLGMSARYENQPFSSVFIPKTFIKTYYDRTFGMDLHAHPNLELMYLVSGHMSVEQADGTATHFEAHQFVLILHDCFHRLVPHSDDIELLVLEITAPPDGPTLDAYIASAPEFAAYPTLQNIMRSNAPVLLFSDTDNVYETLSHLLNILNEHEHGTHNEFFELDYEVSVKQLLISVCRCRTVYLDISDNRHINRAMEYIRMRYAEPLTVEDVAAYIGVTPSYTQKLFRAATGMTVMKTVNYYRMKQSEYLLTATDLSLVAIARKTGFNTQNNFYKHFRAEHKCSPTEYRERMTHNSFYNFDQYGNGTYLLTPDRKP